MQDPDKLEVSHLAEELAITIYDWTDTFPSSERWGLSSQMRRAAVSVGSNIFEGCGYRTNRSLASYLHQSMGSSGELVFQGRIAKRRSYGKIEIASEVDVQLLEIRRKLNKLITTVRFNE